MQSGDTVSGNNAETGAALYMETQLWYVGFEICEDEITNKLSPVPIVASWPWDIRKLNGIAITATLLGKMAFLTVINALQG